MTSKIDTDERLVSRALAAWYRAGGTDQPASDSGVVECAGLLYVVLRDGGGTPLAVYRVRPNGLLKGLKRWPAEIDNS
jgi:hypothetical protein